jgi:hypothetical protein
LNFLNDHGYYICSGIERTNVDCFDHLAIVCKIKFQFRFDSIL